MSGLLSSARLALAEGKFAEAADVARRVLDGAPDELSAWHLLGSALLAGGRAAEAVGAFERAGDAARPERAAALVRADRVAEARVAYEELLRDEPRNAAVRLPLARLCLGTGRLSEGVKHLERCAGELTGDDRVGLLDLAAAVRRATESDIDAAVFLEAHQQGYRDLFDEVAGPRRSEGWYAEAARMAVGPDGVPRPVRPEGARPYALERVDLVFPATGEMAVVATESEPCIVAVEALEPLASLPVLFEWRGQSLPVWVSSRCPWHWFQVAVLFRETLPFEQRLAAVEPVWAEWYLAGFNGSFGTRDEGRFHYTGDPEPLGTRGIEFVVDMGRARTDAVAALLGRLAAVRDRTGIVCVVLGDALATDLP